MLILPSNVLRHHLGRTQVALKGLTQPISASMIGLVYLLTRCMIDGIKLETFNMVRCFKLSQISQLFVSLIFSKGVNLSACLNFPQIDIITAACNAVSVCADRFRLLSPELYSPLKS